jgi:hypothetical protein
MSWVGLLVQTCDEVSFCRSLSQIFLFEQHCLTGMGVLIVSVLCEQPTESRLWLE